MEQILSKVIKVAPPQKLYTQESKAGNSDVVRFVFVGKDSIRKGAKEIVDVLVELRKVRKDFELYLITNIEKYNNYAFGKYQDTETDVEDLRKKIEYNKEWIQFYDKLPNDEVMKIISKCDIGLLPTWADSYGYSVLEFQACGLPVISTNVRSLPEINRNGWLINLPQEPITSIQDKCNRRNQMQKDLYDLILHILDNHHEISIKGQLSLEYIRDVHNPDLYANKIKEIYNKFK